MYITNYQRLESTVTIILRCLRFGVKCYTVQIKPAVTSSGLKHTVVLTALVWQVKGISMLCISSDDKVR